MRFKFLDKITADAGFEAYGKTEQKLFENASLALFSLMCDIKRVEPEVKKTVELKRKTLEELLFDYLDELIFLKDRDVMVFSKFGVEINKNNNYDLYIKAFGERIDTEKHSLLVDVKAVTKHMFKVEKKGDHYKATVVVDI